MARRYTYEEVKKFYEDSECKLLSTEYRNRDSILTFICSCGRERTKSFNSFRSAPNCGTCGKEKAQRKRQKRKIVKCAYCGKDKPVQLYKLDKIKNHYCNRKCQAEHQKITMLGENNPIYNKLEIECTGCGKSIFRTPYEIKNHKYFFCDSECHKKNIGQFFLGENNPNYVEEKEVVCSGCSDTFKRKPSEINEEGSNYCTHQCYIDNYIKNMTTSEIVTNCGNCGEEIKRYERDIKLQNFVYCSRKCQYEHRSIFYVGENSSNWNPNLTDEDRERDRKIPGYTEWRLGVFERDMYTCKCCGDKRGGNIVAHHLDGYNWCKERRTDVSNGVTLCETCHADFHSIYKYGDNTESQYDEWIRNKRKQDAI